MIEAEAMSEPYAEMDSMGHERAVRVIEALLMSVKFKRASPSRGWPFFRAFLRILQKIFLEGEGLPRCHHCFTHLGQVARLGQPVYIFSLKAPANKELAGAGQQRQHPPYLTLIRVKVSHAFTPALKTCSLSW